MQTSERHKPKPVRVAERQVEAAERRARSAEQRALLNASRDTADAARLAADLVAMREDRDRWRAQAERLAVALERVKGPGDRIVVPAGETSDILYGVPPMAVHLGLKVPQVRHLIRNHDLPTFKTGRLVCARRSTLNAWLAEREAAARGGN